MATKEQYLSIQYLRAVAALMVVLFHVSIQLNRMGYTGHWPAGLAGGVDIFFVISGFIMWVTTYNRAERPLAFFRRRIVRIVPLYWLLTTFVLLVLLASPRLLQSTRLDPVHALASYFFLPAVNPSTGTLEPLLIPGWTLNYEMFFYLIFGVTLLVPQRQRLASILVTLGSVVAVGAIADQQRTALSFYGSGIILEFGMGAALGSILTAGARLTNPLAWTLLFLGVGGYAAAMNAGGDASRTLVWGVPAACLVAGALFVEKNRHGPHIPLMHLLGDASYSIYLSHGIALSALGQGWRHLSGAQPISSVGIAFFSTTAIVVASLFGVLIYFYIERPLTRLLSRKVSQPLLPVPKLPV